jgi:hypothetical protein
MHFGVFSTNIAFISGLELAPICSGLITRSCSLKITFVYLPDFVFTFASGRSYRTACGSRCACCSPESLFAALTLPHTFALVE